MDFITKSNFRINQISSIYDSMRVNRIPIFITVIFFFAMAYLSFFHHSIWTETDGIYYLNFGKAILDGNGENVTIVNGQIGGPILFAFLDSLFHDAFTIEKIIALLSGSGIVFLSFFIAKNIFNTRIALVTQLFFAFQPKLQYLSIQALNELLPIFLIMFALFFITKKQQNISHFVLIGILLGASSVFRIQASFVFVSILFYLLIRNKQIKKNFSYILISCIFFIIAFSPQIYYNSSTHDVILDVSPSFYLANLLQFQTESWHDQVINSPDAGIISIISIDVDLFTKNYFYNLFYHNPDRLFNFGTIDNLSIIPLIPFIGLMPPILGLFYCLKTNFDKISKIVLFSSFLISISLLIIINDFQHYFLLLIIIPLVSLILLKIKNIKTNLLPLLILPLFYLSFISVMPIYRSYQIFPMWITIAILSAVFFVEVIPKFIIKIRKSNFKNSNFNTQNYKLLTLLLVVAILFLNLGFSYKLIDGTLYGNTSKYVDIQTEFTNLFQKRDISEQPAMEIKQISEILSEQPNIENKYIMAYSPSIPYYVGSNFIYTSFIEGSANDSVDDFLSRENWNDSDLYLSNILSNPPNRLNEKLPVPDYLIYTPYSSDPNDVWYIPKSINEKLQIFSDPFHSEIPENFKLLYKSNKTDTVVYKIIPNE